MSKGGSNSNADKPAPRRARLAVVTGAAACGKSTVMAGLKACLPEAAWFDSDACVHRLLTLPEVGAKLREFFGGKIFTNGDQVDRSRLRRLVFKDPGSRGWLEAMLHPLVARELANRLDTESCPWLFAEVPLFFETSTEIPSDLVIAVVASPAVQQGRLRDRGLDAGEIKGLLAAQWPVSRKMQHADICLWNDGSKDALESQVRLLCSGIPF